MAATTTQVLNWPCGLEKVYEMTILDPMGDLDIIRGMKDVKDVRVIRNEVVGEFHHADLAIESDASIPSMLQSLVKPDMIGWDQFGKWRMDHREYIVEVKTRFFTELVKIQVKSTINPKGEGAEMTIKMTTKVDIPLLGGIAEKVINSKVMDSLTTQFKKDIQKLKSK